MSAIMSPWPKPGKSLISRNQIGVIENRFQTQAKRVLTVCSAGCLRSPTAAWLLSTDPWNFNTRSCGTEHEFAIVPLSPVLVAWADDIVVMEEWHMPPVMEIQAALAKEREGIFTMAPVHILDIPDDFAFRDPELVEILHTQFREIFPVEKIQS